MIEKCRILVCGGRHFGDCVLLKEVLDALIKENALLHENIEIVSGHCEGADVLGERYGNEHGCDVKISPADWERYKIKAGPIRNKQMIDYICGFANKYVVAFISLNSKGTKQTVALAKRKGIPVIQTDY